MGDFHSPPLHLDVSQAFRAEALGVFGHRLDLALRRAGQALGVERLHHAAGGDRAAEHLELAGAKFLREIHQFHAEARVRLVNAAAIQRFLEGNALERRRHVQVQRRFPDALQQPFDQRVNVLALDERHFDVNLRELQLAVGALVLVAKTAGELVIPLDAADHEDLFELLRRLRQRVKLPGIRAARHEKFARAFGRGFEQRRRLDFEKALLVHVLPRGDGDLAAQAEVARHFGPAQIEVAIFQAQFLVHLAGDFRVVHRERQHVGHVEHFEFLHHHLDFAGGNFGIVRACGALADLAGDADDAFAAQRRGALEKFLRQIRRIKNGLGAAFAVADVNKDQAAEVAAGMDPAGQA